MINLAQDTINTKDIDQLINWLKTYPQLTKGPMTIEFENKWSQYIGCKYSVFVNSGSSANLAMMYVVRLLLEEQNKNWNNRIIIPALSWATDLAPAIQLGFVPYLCETDRQTLGVDINHFEYLCKTQQCKTAIIVHVLGIPAQLEKIQDICKKYDVILLEDSCESVGSTFNGIKTGCFGLMSSFSYFYAHHLSTIEGGMISTNDKSIYDLLKMVRSHGWDRDLDKQTQRTLRNKYQIDDFNSLYTFYIPGFNIRSTDLQAFLGINQLDNISKHNIKRHENFIKYQKMIQNNYWKISPKIDEEISNFAYPIIHPNKNKIVKALLANDIQCRPLISGSLSRHPIFDKLNVDPSLKKYLVKLIILKIVLVI
jgi:CDP-6-deoxy-D-xylo-4-hexulose-3-dehydrase